MSLFHSANKTPQNREHIRWYQIKRKGKVSIIKVAMNHLNTKSRLGDNVEK
jgi:hypothetical protein